MIIAFFNLLGQVSFSILRLVVTTSWLHRFTQISRQQQIILMVSFAVILGAVATISAIASYRYFQQKPQPITNNLTGLEQQAELDLDQIEASTITRFAVLLAGYGGPGHQGGFLSDVIQVAHIDLTTKKIFLISIPRDFYLSEGYKINAVMSQGMSKTGAVTDGLEALRQKTSQITGLPINYFVGIDFVGFKRTIGEELGSIEVHVSQKLDDPWYPIDGAQLDPCGYTPEEIATLTATHSGFELESKFKCRYERIYYEPGIATMEGHDALAYVRSRHSSSDYDRSRRQAEVLAGIRKKLFDLQVLQKLPQFYQALVDHVSTNLDLDSAIHLAPLLVDAHNFNIQTINLSPENVLQSSKSSAGAFILVPKQGSGTYQEIHSFIQQQLN